MENSFAEQYLYVFIRLTISYLFEKKDADKKASGREDIVDRVYEYLTLSITSKALYTSSLFLKVFENKYQTIGIAYFVQTFQKKIKQVSYIVYSIFVVFQKIVHFISGMLYTKKNPYFSGIVKNRYALFLCCRFLYDDEKIMNITTQHKNTPLF